MGGSARDQRSRSPGRGFRRQRPSLNSVREVNPDALTIAGLHDGQKPSSGGSALITENTPRTVWPHRVVYKFERQLSHTLRG
jgi:hypothetical protein